MRLIAALQKQVRHVAAVVEERDSQIRQLMDERRQLQTELVAESQRLDGLEVCSTSLYDGFTSVPWECEHAHMFFLARRRLLNISLVPLLYSKPSEVYSQHVVLCCFHCFTR